MLVFETLKVLYSSYIGTGNKYRDMRSTRIPSTPTLTNRC